MFSFQRIIASNIFVIRKIPPGIPERFGTWALFDVEKSPETESMAITV